MAFFPFVPLLNRNLSRGNTSHLPDQHFGHVVPIEDLTSALSTHHARTRQNAYNRPWYLPSNTPRHDAGSTVQIVDGRFEINLDVQQFEVEEITVQASDQFITVEAKHDEKQDDFGHVSRHLVRRYVLPAGFDSDQVVSSLSSNGVLTISAPKKAQEPGAFRLVPVVQTGQPAGQLTDTSVVKTAHGNGVNKE